MNIESVHEHITELHKLYGKQAFISLKEAAEYVGCEPETLKKSNTFPIKTISTGKRATYRVPIINLARWCCGE